MIGLSVKSTATLLIYAGPSQTHQILAEDGTDLTARMQLKRGAVVGVYDRLSGKRPGRRVLQNPNWLVLHIKGLSYKRAMRMLDAPDVDEYGPRLRHFWQMAIPASMKARVARNEEITMRLNGVKTAIRHRETNLTLDKA